MDEEESPRSKKKRIPEDVRPDKVSLTVFGQTIEHLMEAARAEAAKVFNVPSSRVAVSIESVDVATRDPFRTDMDTYAQINQLSGYAKCLLKPDPNMPEHDKL